MGSSVLDGEKAGVESGFTLLEVLISVAFMTIVVMTLLQAMSYCVRVSGQAEDRWRKTLSKWNEVQELRLQHEVVGSPVVVPPAARPLTYQEVPQELDETGCVWEVITAVR